MYSQIDRIEIGCVIVSFFGLWIDGMASKRGLDDDERNDELSSLLY